MVETRANDVSRTQGVASGALFRWLEAHGGRVGPLAVRGGNDGDRAVHAARDIAADQLIVQVPAACLMTRERARASEIGRAIDASGVALESSHSYIAAFLLQEAANRASFWRPYLETLPASYPGVPLFFGPEQLGLLRGSFVASDIEKRRGELVSEYEGLRRHVPGFGRFTCEQFVWARVTVVTRVFALRVGGHKSEGLVPLADMLNHKRPPETRWAYDDAREAFVMTAVEDLAAGREVHDSYGAKCNGRFFVNYGFCLEDNEENRAEVPLFEMPQDHPFYAEARAMGLRVRDGVLRFRVPADYACDETRQMFSFLRLACADERDLALLQQAGPQDGKIGPISADNERAALAALADACREALGQFDTTLEQDAALLREPTLSRNARHCILMRSGEKRVLRAYAALAEAVLPLLRAPLPSAAPPAGLGRLGDYVTEALPSLGGGPSGWPARP